LSDEVRRAAAYTVAIPMRGTQESLNAGVAAAVCMYALRREKFL
ncbi:MAG: TrmH family RNA methyltransferase, partial [Candidatus Scatosoma sp.]